MELWTTVMDALCDVTWTTFFGQCLSTRAYDYRIYTADLETRTRSDDSAPAGDRPDGLPGSPWDAIERLHRAGADPARDHDLRDRLVYSALAHRGPDDRLAAPDDDADNDLAPRWARWLDGEVPIRLRHRISGGLRRRGAPRDQPSPEEILHEHEALFAEPDRPTDDTSDRPPGDDADPPAPVLTVGTPRPDSSERDRSQRKRPRPEDSRAPRCNSGQDGRMPISPYIRAMREHVGHDLLLIPSVAVLPRDDDGRILLVRQSDDGRWGTIGGAVEIDEDPRDSAVREAREEAGVEVELTGIRDVLGGPGFRRTYPNGDETAYVSTVFDARVVGGEPRPDHDETTEVRWFSRPELGDPGLDLGDFARLSLTQTGLIDAPVARGSDGDSR